jgi:hypothetical protein
VAYLGAVAVDGDAVGMHRKHMFHHHTTKIAFTAISFTPKYDSKRNSDRLRGAVGSGSAAVESAAVSVVALSCAALCGRGVRWWVGMVGRFVCVIRMPVCARVRVCPGSFHGVPS